MHSASLLQRFIATYQVSTECIRMHSSSMRTTHSLPWGGLPDRYPPGQRPPDRDPPGQRNREIILILLSQSAEDEPQHSIHEPNMTSV